MSSSWAFTERDRRARNCGELLSAEYFDPVLYFDPDLFIAEPSAGCGALNDRLRTAGAAAEPASAESAPVELSPWEAGLESGYWERVGLPLPAGVG